MMVRDLGNKILGAIDELSITACGIVAGIFLCLASNVIAGQQHSVARAHQVVTEVKDIISRVEASKSCDADETVCCFSSIDVGQIIGCVRAIKRKIEHCLSALDLSKAGQDAFVIQSVERFFIKVCARLISVDEQLSLHDSVVCEKLEDFEVGYLAQLEALMIQLIELTNKQKEEKDGLQKQVDSTQKAMSDAAHVKTEQLTDIEHIIEQLLKFGVGSLSREVIQQGELLDKSLAALTEQLQDKQRATNGQIIGMARDIEQQLLSNTRKVQDDTTSYGCTTCTKIISIDRSLSEQYNDRSVALAGNMTAVQDALTKKIEGFGTAQAVQKNESLVKVSNSLASLAVQARRLLEQICTKESVLAGLIRSKMSDTDLGMVLQMSDLMEKICELQIDVQEQISKNFIDVDADIAQRSSALYQKLNAFKADISDTLTQQFSQFGVNIVVQFDALCEILNRIDTLLKAYRSQVGSQLAVVENAVNTRLCEKMSSLTLQDRQNTNQLITQIANFGSSFASAFCVRLSNMQAASLVKNAITSSRINTAQSQVIQAVCSGVSTLESKGNSQQRDVCNKLVGLNSSISAQLNNQLAAVLGTITAQTVCMQGDINTLQSTLGTKIVNGTTGLVTQEVNLINQVSQTFDNLLTDIQLENNGISTKITALELAFLTDLTNVIQELQDRAATVDLELNLLIVAVAIIAAEIAVIALL